MKSQKRPSHISDFQAYRSPTGDCLHKLNRPKQVPFSLQTSPDLISCRNQSECSQPAILQSISVFEGYLYRKCTLKHKWQSPQTTVTAGHPSSFRKWQTNLSVRIAQSQSLETLSKRKKKWENAKRERKGVNDCIQISGYYFDRFTFRPGLCCHRANHSLTVPGGVTPYSCCQNRHELPAVILWVSSFCESIFLCFAKLCGCEFRMLSLRLPCKSRPALWEHFFSSPASSTHPPGPPVHTGDLCNVSTHRSRFFRSIPCSLQTSAGCEIYTLTFALVSWWCFFTRDPSRLYT